MFCFSDDLVVVNSRNAFSTPHWSRLTRNTMSDAARDAAITLMRSGNYQSALESFKTLIADEPRDWTLFYMAGQCARFTNDIQSATAYLLRATELDDSQPQVFLALGIAQQIQGQLWESQEAFRKALELDSDYDLAYNSLALTQKKMGKLDLALHNLEEGLKVLSRSIARKMRNTEENKIFPHPNIRGRRWVKYALNAATYLCANEPDIKLAWPTGGQAIAETDSQVHRGLYWLDTTDTERAKTRLFLPNFFNTFFSLLRSESPYAHMLGNLGSVLELQGNQEEAELCYEEAKEFLAQ